MFPYVHYIDFQLLTFVLSKTIQKSKGITNGSVVDKRTGDEKQLTYFFRAKLTS